MQIQFYYYQSSKSSAMASPKLPRQQIIQYMAEASPDKFLSRYKTGRLLGYSLGVMDDTTSGY